MVKVEIYRINKITAGGFHCWCRSNVGTIRKPNNIISQSLWDEFNRIGVAEIGIESSWFKSLLLYLKSLWQRIKKIFQKK